MCASRAAGRAGSMRRRPNRRRCRPSRPSPGGARGDDVVIAVGRAGRRRGQVAVEYGKLHQPVERPQRLVVGAVLPCLAREQVGQQEVGAGVGHGTSPWERIGRAPNRGGRGGAFAALFRAAWRTCGAESLRLMLRATPAASMGPIDFGHLRGWTEGSIISGRTTMARDNAVSRSELLAPTVKIVSAHVANNAVERDEVAPPIQSVFDKLNTLASDEEPASVELTPAVPIRRSVTDDYIGCLEDGKKLKMLKRHLVTAYGMTPEEYRAKWGPKPTTRWWRRTMPPGARNSRSRSGLAGSRWWSLPNPHLSRGAVARLQPNADGLHNVVRRAAFALLLIAGCAARGSIVVDPSAAQTARCTKSSSRARETPWMGMLRSLAVAPTRSTSSTSKCRSHQTVRWAP